jgi:hypothetical protein
MNSPNIIGLKTVKTFVVPISQPPTVRDDGGFNNAPLTKIKFHLHHLLPPQMLQDMLDKIEDLV